MSTTRVYSDISKVDNVIAFANAEVSGIANPVYRTGQLTKTTGSTCTCEIMALAHGVATSRPSERLLAHTDIVDLKTMYEQAKQGITSRSRKSGTVRALAFLQRAAQRHKSVEIVLVDRRDPLYVVCHRRAKRLARRVAQRVASGPRR